MESDRDRLASVSPVSAGWLLGSACLGLIFSLVFVLRPASGACIAVLPACASAHAWVGAMELIARRTRWLRWSFPVQWQVVGWGW